MPSPKWVRVMLAGETIADSKRVMLLREPGHVPAYFFPRQDVRTEYLSPSEHRGRHPRKGETAYWTVRVGERQVENAACTFLRSQTDTPDPKDYVMFDWYAMDAWFEEDEEVYVHPRDPYTRVDIATSSRNVRVVVGGETVAETNHPTLLFETGLPTRYYIPKVDLRMELLLPSDTLTACPYKGEARYFSVRVGNDLFEDIAWYYPFPTLCASGITNMICFYNERVDALYVDDELMERPQTPWSR